MKDMLTHDPEKIETTILEHNENPVSGEVDPFDYEKINYGDSGLKGLLSSPYVFGATFLASLGGFSFGYGKSLRIVTFANHPRLTARSRPGRNIPHFNNDRIP